MLCDFDEVQLCRNGAADTLMSVCITALYTVAVLCVHVCHTRHVCYCPGGEGDVGYPKYSVSLSLPLCLLFSPIVV